MSNHVKVTTKKAMTAIGITNLLTRLNEQRFKNVLNIQYLKQSKDGPGLWGPHEWEISVKEFDEEDPRFENGFMTLECWLNNRRSFEIRHISGTFIWWVDLSISNEVALTFDGKRCDDADGKKEKGVAGKYDDWDAFAVRMNFGRGLPEWELEWTPKVFHNVKIFTSQEIEKEMSKNGLCEEKQ